MVCFPGAPDPWRRPWFSTRTQTAAAQRDRLQLDGGRFPEARRGEALQHRPRQQQRVEVDSLRQKDVVRAASRLYVVRRGSSHGRGHVAAGLTPLCVYRMQCI